MKRVLAIDDDKLILWSLRERLSSEGYEVLLAETGEEGQYLLAQGGVDLVLLDLRLPDMDGMEFLRCGKEWLNGLPVIVITAHGSIEAAVEAVREGAYDFLTKPIDLDTLLLRMDKAFESADLKREVKRLRSRESGQFSFSAFIYQSDVLREVLSLAERIARSDTTTVLLQGESGTGKDLLAGAIHYASPRADRPFIELTCSAVPAALLETELFGYEKGAFTDASAAKPGLLELADKGTLFLNEIGDMELPLQAKILTVIERGEFRRVGGSRPLRVDIRLISATNKDLRALCARGEFREDLFYRLNVFPITLPPLRQRREDVLVLARHFLQHFSRRLRRRPSPMLSPEAERALLAYPWPGNVRELMNFMERVVILAAGDVVEVADLGLAPPDDMPESVVQMPEEGAALEEVERQLLQQALELTAGNQSQAARLLRIGRNALRYKMNKYGLSAPSDG
jgi:DNA-binding NtrC family response regulator